ncbi:hypothetical protein [Streptomyces sp. G1]|uniref:hypothetical protein n=1 Tax=Streptomyces sp. G1 TaxID=361572 RepID=UPI0020303E46|nr:hypothetical protein [Streptomyces sp. G1]MCM1965096.1 hypothetical protein [Streptomyces sp. G1]
MSSHTTGPAALHVPVEVHALAVTPKMGDRTFVRHTPNFELTAGFHQDPEPAPFSNEDPHWAAAPAHHGVYVQWTLPAALRTSARASTDPATTPTALPAAPNRWLVTRKGAGPDVSWVVHSDYRAPTATTPYAVHTPGGIEVTRIGRHLPLSAWRPESGQDGTPLPAPLTALGPGLPSFAAFQPYNADVFSLFDPLAGVGGSATLHYTVVGWRAEPEHDILARGADAARLKALGWTAQGAGAKVTRTVYAGAVRALAWNPEADPAIGALPDPMKVGLAVGPTAIDAFAAAFSSPSVPDQDRLTPAEAEVLTGFAAGHTGALDQVDGAHSTADRRFTSAFLPRPGGYRWRVVASPKTHPDRVRALRDQLNEGQSRLDRLRGQLAAAQRELYAIWLASMDMACPQELKQRLTAQCDAQAAGTAAAEVAARKRAVDEAAGTVPVERPGYSLEAAIADYRAAHGIEAGLRLVREDLPTFHQALDPVLLLTFDHTTPPLREADGPLLCRTTDHLDVVDPVGGTPLSGSSDLDAAIHKQAAELDRETRQGVGGPGVSAWRHPWQPLYLEWEAVFRPVVFTGDGSANWTFDGTRYSHLGGDPGSDGQRTIRGRQWVDPKAADIFSARLRQLLAGQPDAAVAAAAKEFIRATSDWRVLAQPLTGLTGQLACRLTGFAPAPPVSPTAGAPHPVGSLTGRGFTGTPVFGAREPDAPSLFLQTRAGQFFFQRLVVVDRFGQALDLITDQSRNRGVDVSARLDYSPSDKRRRDIYIRMQPRLPQPARLSFEPLDAEGKVPGKGTTAPLVCGWLVPNHADRTLLAYAPDGVPYQELGPTGATALPVPPDPVTGRARSTPTVPASFSSFVTRAAGHFGELWPVIESALHTISTSGPSGHAHLGLMGRPMALVRARIALELDGPPLYDPRWYNLIPPATGRPAPAFTSYPWAVRLGEEHRFSDGLIGYLLDDPDSLLHCPQGPQGPHGAWTQAATERHPHVKADGSHTDVTLLMDAYTAVHATTGLVPPVALRLPEPALRPLQALAAYFRLGPLLSPTSSPDASVVLPAGPSMGRHWQWYETAPERWHAVQPADAHAVPGAPTAPARTGRLVVTPVPPHLPH